MSNPPLVAEILSIGEELLSGDSDIVDTNSIYINQALSDIGLRVLYKSTVGDHEQRIVDVIRSALNRVDVVIMTGGLGPTVDDMTRQAAAIAAGVELELRLDLMDELTAKFEKIGARMTDNNRIQATLPEGAIAIPNPTGTAPGFIMELGNKTLMSMPGVPREMKAMMDQTVIPYLRQRVQTGGVIKVRVLRTAGIGESLLDEAMGDLEKLTNPVVGLAAHTGQVDIRISAHGTSEAEADALIAQVETDLRNRIGQYIYGVDKEPLPEAFAAALERTRTSLALAEIGTCGLLHEKIQANVPIQVIELTDPLADISDHKKSKDYVVWKAEEIRQQTGAGLAIVILCEKGATAIGMSNGIETRSRAYPYNLDYNTNTAISEWAVAWAMSMGWHLLTSGQKEKN